MEEQVPSIWKFYIIFQNLETKQKNNAVIYATTLEEALIKSGRTKEEVFAARKMIPDETQSNHS